MTEEEREEARARRLDNAFDIGMCGGVALMIYGAYLMARPLALMLAGFFLAFGCFAFARAHARSRHK